MSNSGGIKSFHPRELPHSSDEKLNIQATGLMTRPSYLRRFSKKQNNFRFYIYCKEFLVLFLGSCSSLQRGCLRAGQVSWNSGTSINVSCTAYKRRVPQGKRLVFFLPYTLKTTFKWEFRP